MRVILGILGLIGLGCQAGNFYSNDNYQSVTNYPVHYTQDTLKGLRVDGDRQLDLAEIDRRTDEVEACLARLFPDGVLPDEVVKDGQCLFPSFDTRIHRDSLGVKLAPDWHWTPDDCDNGSWGKQQVFACGQAPTALCAAKGLVVTEACPCCWRGAVQGNSVIVTTPSLELYKETLIRLTTGCNFIWSNPLSSCYTG